MLMLRVMVLGVVVVCCAGFVPVSGCAKGCGRVGRTGADDFARVGGSYSDDLARGTTRPYGSYTDDLVRGGTTYRPRGAVVVGGAGHTGDDLAHLSRSSLDDTIAGLPEAEGGINSLVRKPTSNGTVLDGLDDGGRTFGADYAKSVDELAITRKQHDGLMDAFETAQDLGQDLIEALVDDDEDEPDVDRMSGSMKARQRLQLIALELEAEVANVLTPEQLRRFRRQFGSSEVVAYRLAKERPIVRRPPAKAKRGESSDKVAP